MTTHQEEREVCDVPGCTRHDYVEVLSHAKPPYGLKEIGKHYQSVFPDTKPPYQDVLERFRKRFTAVDWSEKRKLIDIVGLDLLPDLEAFITQILTERDQAVVEMVEAMKRSEVWRQDASPMENELIKANILWNFALDDLLAKLKGK